MRSILHLLSSILVLSLTLVGRAVLCAPPPLSTINHQLSTTFTTPPKKIPSNSSTDAPLLGNGDFLAAFAGTADQLQFHLSKADLWELRPDSGPRALARLSLELPAMTNASYRVTQDLRSALTTGVFEKNGVTLTVESAVAATENTLWVRLSTAGGSLDGACRLLRPGQTARPTALADTDQPAAVGRESYGGGRYYFDGEIADVVITNGPLSRPLTPHPVKPETFDGKAAWHPLPAPRMDQTVSVGAWIKINRAAPDANYIVSKGEWNQAYSLGLSGGCLRWAVNGAFIQTAKPLPTGVWLCVVGTFDGRASRIYVDGQLAVGEEPDASLVECRYDQNVARPTGAACVLRLLPPSTINHHPSTKFTLTPGKPVTLVVAASGLANTPNYRADALQRAAAATEDSLASLRRRHEAWWAGFWAKSFVEIPDKTLEQRYYLSHYCLASCSRLPHFPPGLFGWTLSPGAPMWGGAYFNNYNFFAPFYGAYAANHLEQAMPCNDAVLDALELGRAWCRDEASFERMCKNSLPLKQAAGILLPVSMLPYGVCGAPTTWGQRSDAAYACVPLASTWYATYDLDFAKRSYPFVRETALFWEHYLVLENGRYVDRNDAALENSGRDLNPIVSLALIRQVMDLATDMSTALGVDSDQHAQWRDLRDRLSDYPCCTVGDLPPDAQLAVPKTPENLRLPIFRYSEQGVAWQKDNAVGIQHIFPGNGIGLGVRPELLERARNQIRVLGRWIDLNGCNSFYPAAARVGYDPVELLSRLRHWVDTASPNGMRADNPHGSEQFSVVPCTLQEMLLQSYDGVLRFFPCWPKDQDARFGTLRARGAFLVSAERKNGVVTGVKILSEKGRDCTVQNPWPSRKVRRLADGVPAETLSGERFTFPTQPGQTIELNPEG
jgi:hypothetical protein